VSVPSPSASEDFIIEVLACTFAIAFGTKDRLTKIFRFRSGLRAIVNSCCIDISVAILFTYINI